MAARIRFPANTKACHTLHPTEKKGLAYPEPKNHQPSMVHTLLQAWEAKYKLCTLWINLVGEGRKSNTEGFWRTLRVPGQVVCDGIKEELSCLLPLIVKLLLVIGVTHTMQCYRQTTAINLTKIVISNTSGEDCAGIHAYLVALVWVGSQRFKDADCVSVGGGNLKIKSCVHHLITHPISAATHQLKNERGGEETEKHGRRRHKVKAGPPRARNKRQRRLALREWAVMGSRHLPCQAGGSTPRSPPGCFHSELLG